MKQLTAAVLALALSVSLAACSKATDTTGTGSSTTPSASATSTASSTPSDTTSGTSAAGDSTTAAKPVVVDQSTPEAAMTSWLGSMVAGDGKTVCELMATGGKTISSIPGAAAACGKTITPMLDQLKELAGAFQGLKITGATVSGDNATFESVTTEPALAADVVSSFKAVRIGGKWYVTKG